MNLSTDQSTFWTNRDYRGEQFFIVIPSYKEASLVDLMESIRVQKCDIEFGIIVLFNASKTEDESFKQINQRAFDELRQWTEVNSMSAYLELQMNNKIPSEQAGVGMARKLGMDRACDLIHTNTDNGVLICLDADCMVSSNYMDSIASFYDQNPQISAANIYFEHRPLTEDIIQYELHLRYFKQALRYVSYPFAYHTVGSSMSVRSKTYVKSGGMNRRQAGEDFYFLQKLFTQFPFGEINECTVYPSPRKSDRVPFGTGRAMHLYDPQKGLDSYSFKSFEVISKLFQRINQIQEVSDWDGMRSIEDLHPALQSFLVERKWEDFHNKVASQSLRNVKDLQVVFYRWMNNFQMIKYLHYMRDRIFPDEPVGEVCNDLLIALGETAIKGHALQLDMFRKLDKLASF